jgi:hypothetical protein
MKTPLASILGLTALTSVALAGEPMRLTLAQMDQVTAGQARASAEASGSLAVGPSKTLMSASGKAIGSTSASVTTTIGASITSTPGRVVSVASTSSSAIAR